MLPNTRKDPSAGDPGWLYIRFAKNIRSQWPRSHRLTVAIAAWLNSILQFADPASLVKLYG